MSKQFSDTSNKNGLIQDIEWWCGRVDGDISGNTTELQRITSRVNSALDRLMPKLLSGTDRLRWDDPNHTKKPIGKFDLSTTHNDYTITVDEQSIAILNFSSVRILSSATGTVFTTLSRIYLDDPRAEEMMAPISTNIGIPSAWLEKENTIFLDKIPSYNATAGGEVFFEREASYFVYSDTTKKPGIPSPFHDLLALYPALDWLLIYKPESVGLINNVKEEIVRREQQLVDLMEKRNPQRRRLETSYTSSGAESGRISSWGTDSNK